MVGDTDFGFVRPIRVIETLGSDFIPINVGCQLETAATNSPIYGSLRSNVRAFFFPRRLLATVASSEFGHLPAVFNPEGATEENAVNYVKFLPYAHVSYEQGSSNVSECQLISAGRGSLLEALGFPCEAGLDNCNTGQAFPEQIRVEANIYAVDVDPGISTASVASTYTAASIVMYMDLIYNYYCNHHFGRVPFRVCFLNTVSSPVAVQYSYQYVSVEQLSAWLVAVKTGRARYVLADFRLLDADGIWLKSYDLFGLTTRVGPVEKPVTVPYVWGAFAYDSESTQYKTGDGVGMSLCTFSPDINTAWISDQEYATWLSKAKVTVKNNEVAYEDIITASSFYREATKFALGDGTFEDFYAAVNGVRSRPSGTTSQYLGGFGRRVDFQSIRQSAATQEGSLGDIGGFAAGAQAGHIVNFYANEPGYIMICHTLVPDLTYSGGVESYLLKTQTDDFYSPNFANIGYQPRTLAEADLYSSTNKDALQTAIGYQPAWTEYTTAVSRAFGSMARGGLLAFWTFQAPRFSTSVNFSLSARTVYCHPSDFNNIFVVNKPNVHNFYMQYGFDVKPRRIIPKRNMPKLML